jgi:hypothetical protein
MLRVLLARKTDRIYFYNLYGFKSNITPLSQLPNVDTGTDVILSSH